MRIATYFVICLLLTGFTAAASDSIEGFSRVVTINGQDLEITLEVGPVVQSKGSPLVSRNRASQSTTWLAEDFVGVARSLEYTIKPLKGKLPKNLVVREELVELEANYRGIPLNPKGSSAVIRGKFSDIQALGAKNGYALPDDLRQVVLLRLFLNDVEFAVWRVEFMPGRGVINIQSAN